MDWIEEQHKKFLAAVGHDYPYRPPVPPKPKNPDKILVLSDPHEPFSHQATLRAALKAAGDAALVVVPGDLGDYYSKSRFKKTRKVSFGTELQAVFARMEWLSAHWPKVKILIGNHDNRPEKKLQSYLGDDVDLLLLTEQNLLMRMASYFRNVEIVGIQLDGSDINLSHLYQLGDIVFCHGELSRVQQTATLEYISKYLRNWGKCLALKPWRVIAQAHNHQSCKRTYGPETHFMLPTCSNPYSVGMEYIYSARLIGSPPAVGFTVFMQDHKTGVTDTNNSHNYTVPYEWNGD